MPLTPRCSRVNCTYYLTLSRMSLLTTGLGGVSIERNGYVHHIQVVLHYSKIPYLQIHQLTKIYLQSQNQYSEGAFIVIPRRALTHCVPSWGQMRLRSAFQLPLVYYIYFLLYTFCKYTLHCLFSTMWFAFFVGFTGDLKMTPKHSAEVRSSVFQCKKTDVPYREKSCAGKCHSGMS